MTLGNANPNKDADMDGVPDILDQCIDTPFLDEVSANGCSVNTLIFPEERDNGSFDVSLGYGFNNDEDSFARGTQFVSKLQMSYYLNDWSYSLRTGYFTTDDTFGTQDTIIKIKRKFKLTKSLKIGVGAGVKLPTYDFTGNNTDYMLYASIIYYPKSALSIFSGVSHTFVNDDEIVNPIEDINAFYVGTGYFFTRDFYANISYSYAESKFIDNHPEKSIVSTIFYRIDEKWFSTLSYSHELEDELHNSLNFKIGYSIW